MEHFPSFLNWYQRLCTHDGYSKPEYIGTIVSIIRHCDASYRQSPIQNSDFNWSCLTKLIAVTPALSRLRKSSKVTETHEPRKSKTTAKSTSVLSRCNNYSCTAVDGRILTGGDGRHGKTPIVDTTRIGQLRIFACRTPFVRTHVRKIGHFVRNPYLPDLTVCPDIHINRPIQCQKRWKSSFSQRATLRKHDEAIWIQEKHK